mmetsp:Transcript_16766/g.29597  ORF Transcript_16766/g.29597 Transcript_16766/m.29597 type:complete len:111 (+) Transcript_16766:19-351(+)
MTVMKSGQDTSEVSLQDEAFISRNYRDCKVERLQQQKWHMVTACNGEEEGSAEEKDDDGNNDNNNNKGGGKHQSSGQEEENKFMFFLLIPTNFKQLDLIENLMKCFHLLK